MMITVLLTHKRLFSILILSNSEFFNNCANNLLICQVKDLVVCKGGRRIGEMGFWIAEFGPGEIYFKFHGVKLRM